MERRRVGQRRGRDEQRDAKVAVRGVHLGDDHFRQTVCVDVGGVDAHHALASLSKRPREGELTTADPSPNLRRALHPDDHVGEPVGIEIRDVIAP